VPIAKTAVQEQPKVEVSQAPLSPGIVNMAWEGVPIDFFRYFNILLGTVPDKEIGQLKDIFEWAKSKCDEPNMGNVLQKISSLENTLGSPNLGEKRFKKIWMWVKMTKHMDDIDKQRKALEKGRWV